MKRLLLVAALAAAQSAAQAQAWPVKPLRAIVPVGAGSSTDIVHRLVLEQLAAGLGQPIVVENRTGAGGTIGSAAVAKAEPDGYTLLANGSAHTIAPALYKSLPYDAARDFVPVVADRQLAKRAGRFAFQGDHHGASPGGGCESASRRLEFLLRRHRHRHAPERGALRVERRNQRGAHSVQGRRGGHARCDRGPGRFLLRPGRPGAAAYPRRQARRTGGQRPQALGNAAGRTDVAGGGIPRCRVPDLVRSVRAGEDAGRRGREAQPRNAARPAARPRCARSCPASAWMRWP